MLQYKASEKYTETEKCWYNDEYINFKELRLYILFMYNIFILHDIHITFTPLIWLLNAQIRIGAGVQSVHRQMYL